MDCLAFIAEQKIAQAIAKGELKTSGWENRPLPLEDDHMVPADLKMAYKILKNAGYLPPEIEARKEINRLEGTDRHDGGRAPAGTADAQIERTDDEG
jgi:Domain of unknown function (DUF1992)